MTDAAPSPAPVDPDDEGGADRPRPSISRWQKAVGAAGLVVVAWVGYDSTLVRAWFDDSAPASHMPDGMDHGEDGPERDEAPRPDPAGGEHAPPDDGGDMHDPTQWDH